MSRAKVQLQDPPREVTIPHSGVTGDAPIVQKEERIGELPAQDRVPNDLAAGASAVLETQLCYLVEPDRPGLELDDAALRP